MSWRLGLEYFRILFDWPPIFGGALIVFIALNHKEVRTFISRLSILKTPWVEAATGQLARPAEPLVGQPGGDGNIDNAVALADQATALIWEFRYLNYYLAPSSQQALQWLAGLEGGATTLEAFNAVWSRTLAEERTAVIEALARHGLISQAGRTIRVEPKGRGYLSWPERRVLLVQATLVPNP